MYETNPTPDDLSALLMATQLPIDWSVALPALNLQVKCDTARARFEGAVGRKMLATTQTRAYDPPTNAKGLLDLGADLVSVTELTIAGVAQVEDTDFYLEPLNADMDGRPFRRITFARTFPNLFYPTWPLQYPMRKGIRITGPWGFGLTLPATAWQATLSQAALLCYPELALVIGKGLQSREEGDFKKTFARGKGNGPLLEEVAGWQAQFDAGVSNCLLVEVGL